MVVCEKALKRCIKEAYKNQGYSVAVTSGWMIINSGYWLVRIAEKETSNELRSLITLHMRDLPRDGEAFKTIKGNNGPIVQKMILEEALKPIARMEEHLVDTMGEGEVFIRRTDLRLGSCVLWQNARDLQILLVDPRYEALLESVKDVRRAGTGLYADDPASTAWILGVVDNSAHKKLEHLARFRWVHE